MNTDKTGVFIATLRKELGLTQAQLAEKLNITDKAVSRWETGKGLPDSSLLIPLSETLGISVNELLSGEKISEDEFSKVSDDNLVDAVEKSENVEKKRKRDIIFLIITTVLCLISVLFLILNLVNKNDTVSYKGNFNTKNRIAVTELLIELDNQKHYFSEYTVCTDIDVRLNRNGDFRYAKIKMNDEAMHENIELSLFIPNEQPEILSYIITRNFNHYSTEDGILYTDFCEFLCNDDFLAAAESYSEINDYDIFYITASSSLYFNFDSKYPTGFFSQHLFSEGNFSKVSNSEGMNGKYYEIGVGTINSDTGANDTCFGVYIAR